MIGKVGRQKINLVRFVHNWNEMLEHESFGNRRELSGRMGTDKSRSQV